MDASTQPPSREPPGDDSTASKKVRSKFTFPVVAIGASAGGLKAIETFFHHLPANTGAAYILVQHLSPAHRSMMREILTPHTSLKIQKAEHDSVLSRNVLYTIQPGTLLEVRHGRLRVIERSPDRGDVHTIDRLFSTLAQDRGPQSVAIVLSGTGSDGAEGILEIKRHGGLVFVQDEHTAAFNGMPRAAVATGSVDMILAPQDMPAHLTRLLEYPPPERDAGVKESDNPIVEILTLLQKEGSVDFRLYKEETVNRRIEKQMAAHSFESMQSYLEHLRDYPSAVRDLRGDLLVGMTEFFRDSEVFEALRAEVIRPLVAAFEPESDEIRVWIAGCSTGEEAYSIAMLIYMEATEQGKPVDYRIFATDVDQTSLAHASEALYLPHKIKNVPEDVLALCFEEEESGFRVKRRLRERIVFAQHDITRDPPFTRCHLVSCRNLLIYFRPGTQEIVLELLEYALNGGGALLLGSGESTVAGKSELEELGRGSRLYRNKGTSKRPRLSAAAPQAPNIPWTPRTTSRKRARKELSQYDLTVICEFLALRDAQALVILNRQFEVVHIMGDATKILRLPSGAPSKELNRLLPEAGRSAVMGALYRTKLTQTEVIVKGLLLGTAQVDVRVRCLAEPERDDLFMLSLGASTASPNEAMVVQPDTVATQHVADLEREVETTREGFQIAIEELETTNEELQSMNEELVTSNEELQSANEELHSVNEELHTLSEEQKHQINKLDETTEDLKGLIDSSAIAFIILDADLRIRTFSNSVRRLTPLIEADVGRPFFQLNHVESIKRLSDTLQAALDQEQSLDLEVTDLKGHRYLLRVRPFVTATEGCTGIILNFIDLRDLTIAPAQARGGASSPPAEVTASLPAVLWLVDFQPGHPTKVRYRSAPNAEFLGGTPEPADTGAPAWGYPLVGDDLARIEAARDRLRTTDEYLTRYRVKDHEGRVRWIEDRGRVVSRNNSAARVRVAGMSLEVPGEFADSYTESTASLAAEESTETTPPTLLNRAALERRYADELARAARDGLPLAGTLVHFRANAEDQSAGSPIPRVAQSRLNALMRSGDSAGQVDSNLWLILSPNASLAEARIWARRLVTHLAEPRPENGHQDISGAISIGVADLSAGSPDLSRAVQRCRDATTPIPAEEAGTRASGSATRRAADQISRLRELMNGEEPLMAVAQPLIDLRTGRGHGYEVCVRGPSDGGFEMPHALFGAAHELGCSESWDLRALKSCALAARSLELREGERIHLNILPSTILSVAPRRLADKLSKYRPTSDYCLEISERQFVGDPSSLAKSVAALRDEGFSTAIEHVGLSRRSLEAVIHLEPQFAKIENHVLNAARERDSERCDSTLAMLECLRRLSTVVVAQQIESEADRELLSGLGLSYAQGYLWGNPVHLIGQPTISPN